MWCGVTAVAPGRDDRLDRGVDQFLADGVGKIVFVGQQGIDPVRDHAHQRAEALTIMRLSGRPDEGGRRPLGIAPGAELGGEPATRPAAPIFVHVG
jgi:hypothetical protein